MLGCRKRVRLLLGLCCALSGCTTDMSNTTAPPGDLTAYEPFAHVAEVAAFAGKNAKLVEIKAHDVPSNGKIPLSTNLTARVDYQFITKDEKNRYQSVHVEVMKPRVMDVSQDSTSHSKQKHLGMGRDAVPLGRTALSGALEKLVEKPRGSSSARRIPKTSTSRRRARCRSAAPQSYGSRPSLRACPKASTANVTYDAKGYALEQLRQADATLWSRLQIGLAGRVNTRCARAVSASRMWRLIQVSIQARSTSTTGKSSCELRRDRTPRARGGVWRARTPWRQQRGCRALSMVVRNLHTSATE